MNKILKITLSILLVSMFFISNAQRDPHFSQPINGPLTLNPAMMALHNDFRAIFNYRNQWGNINKGYQTYAGTLMYPVFLKSKKDSLRMHRLDLGVNILYDKAGALKRVNGTFSVAYGLHLNAANLVSAALNIGFENYGVNWNDQTFVEQFVNGSFDSDNLTGENPAGQRWAADVGFGLLWRFTPEKGILHAFAGVSGYHLNQPNLSLTGGSARLPSRYNFQAGLKVVSKKVDFIPVLMFNHQSSFDQVVAGFLLNYKISEKAGKIVAGSWYNSKEAIPVQVGYEHPNFGVHYSYDFGISALTRNTKGIMAHEVSVVLKWESKKGNKGIAFF